MGWTHTGHPGQKSPFTYIYRCSRCHVSRRYVGVSGSHYCPKCHRIMDSDPSSRQRRQP